jgi:small subunit ribosomal protein S21
MQVLINNRGHLEMAIRSFRKKTQREGLVKEARRRKAFEKPSEEKKRKQEESLVKTKRSRRSGSTGYNS